MATKEDKQILLECSKVQDQSWGARCAGRADTPGPKMSSPWWPEIGQAVTSQLADPASHLYIRLSGLPGIDSRKKLWLWMCRQNDNNMSAIRHIAWNAFPLKASLPLHWILNVTRIKNLKARQWILWFDLTLMIPHGEYVAFFRRNDMAGNDSRPPDGNNNIRWVFFCHCLIFCNITITSY